MANFQDYPVYKYNEPATYEDFKGGINLDPASENLADNELRDAVNFHYTNNILKKRRGAKKLLGIISPRLFHKIQGVFLFVAREAYLIVAADGRLYYSLYNEDIDLKLSPLPIKNLNNTEGMNSENQFYGLTRLSYNKASDEEHDGYVYEYNNDTELVFQNKYEIEAASSNDKLYVATGTRLVEVHVADNNVNLEACCVLPYRPDGMEYNLYGQNNMSPFPMVHLQEAGESSSAFIKNIICEKQAGGFLYTAIMLYPAGEISTNYCFKWELGFPRRTSGQIKYEWHTIVTYKDMFGSQSMLITYDTLRRFNKDLPKTADMAAFENIRVRCSFAKDFEQDDGGNAIEENGDYVPSQLTGSSFGSFTSVSLDPDSDEFSVAYDRWQILQSCKKILADGNKFIYYDDAYGTGEWFKSIIGNPGYVVDRGCLSFKTTKNEKITKVVHFKGILVVFSSNNLVGGNISVVTGNGDDDPSDNGYSPYIRKVVSPEITCDCANSVQISENLIFFKYLDTVYAIEGSSLSTEIVSLYSMNDKLKMSGRTVNVPWADECRSEITREYYSLIWPKKTEAIEGEIVVTRPAMRLKMYYNIGQEIDGKVYFPWLRDEGEVFNITSVITINGKSLLLRNFELIHFDDEVYSDLGKSYDATLKFKAYDLNYPKLVKYIKKIILYYHRSQYSDIQLEFSAINEAGHTLVDNKAKKTSVQDKATLIDGVSEGKIGATLTDTKTYNVDTMFPLLQAAAQLTIKCDGSFVFNSMTFDYKASRLPTKNQFDGYQKISRVSTPISLRKINTGSEYEDVSDNTFTGRPVNAQPIRIRTTQDKEVTLEELGGVNLKLSIYGDVGKVDKAARKKISIYVDTGDAGKRMSLAAIKDMNTKILSCKSATDKETEILDEGDYVFSEE